MLIKHVHGDFEPLFVLPGAAEEVVGFVEQNGELGNQGEFLAQGIDFH